MARSRLVRRAVPVAVLALFALAPAPLGARAPQPAKPDKPADEGGEIEVRYIDDSAMKLKLLDDKLELVTKHGILRVAVADVRKIEFATRVPPDVAEKVALAIAKLNHSEFKVREDACAELKQYKARAYPALLKAMKSEDPEVSRRAEECAAFIKTKVPAALLEVREFDVVHTDDSKIAGRLTAEFIKVGTFQFGEQKVKLHDLHALGTGRGGNVDLAGAIPAPTHMTNYQNQFNKEFVFTVTGAPVGTNGSVWGTDQYTLDSHFQSAVVHAGLAKPGETVTVRVRIVVSPPAFTASTRNGITTTSYGVYPTGAYEFVRR